MCNFIIGRLESAVQTTGIGSSANYSQQIGQLQSTFPKQALKIWQSNDLSKACFSFQKKINIFLVEYLQTPYLMLYLSSINRSKKQPVLLTQQVIDFLKAQYDFRYNLLTEEAEFRPSSQRNVSFCRIDRRGLNSFCPRWGYAIWMKLTNTEHKRCRYWKIWCKCPDSTSAKSIYL